MNTINQFLNKINPIMKKDLIISIIIIICIAAVFTAMTMGIGYAIALNQLGY